MNPSCSGLTCTNSQKAMRSKQRGEVFQMLTEKKKEFIEFMLSAQVLRFGHFVTKSGRNTQYFVNTGNYKTCLLYTSPSPRDTR